VNQGGGIYFSDSAEGELRNATITDNTAGNFGAGLAKDGNGTVNVSGSIIAVNFGPVGVPGVGIEVLGTINSLGKNIIGIGVGTSDGGDGYHPTDDLLDQTGLQLGVLADNGGPVQTHELLPGSVGIDTSTGLATDARGYAVSDGSRDSGAFELGAQELVVVDGLTVGENSPNGTSISSAIATPIPDAIAINQILTNDSSLVYDQTTGKFYRAVEGNFSWHEANAGATSASIGVATGQLVTIRSQYENDLVQGLANSLSNPEDLWIGASDQNTEGNWHWYADGAEVGDPSALGPQEDFALFRRGTGLWDDSNVTSAIHSYVIEWDVSEVLGNFLLFTLSNDAAGRFAIDSTTGEITVANGALLNHEAAEDFTITVENFNEGPTFQETVIPEFKEDTVTTSVAGAAPLATGDVDGDGYLDLVSTGTGNTIVWYENDGASGFNVNTVGSESGVRALTLTDVDGDGDTDLVVATSNFLSDGLLWYENDGNQNFTEHTITTTTRGANSVTTADVDSDGDIDLLVASSFQMQMPTVLLQSLPQTWMVTVIWMYFRPLSATTKLHGMKTMAARALQSVSFR